jgi:hypothetical protein
MRTVFAHERAVDEVERSQLGHSLSVRLELGFRFGVEFALDLVLVLKVGELAQRLYNRVCERGGGRRSLDGNRWLARIGCGW